MAGPFDISTYDTAPPPAAGANTADTLARANRAARVAQFGEDTVARMEAAGRLFGGATPSPQPTVAAPVGPTAEPVTRFSRLKNLLNPNITAGGIGRFIKGGLPVATAVGTYQAATDTPQSVADLGGVGVPYPPGASTFEDTMRDIGGTKVGSNIMNLLDRIGHAASFGLVGRDFGDAAPAAAAPVVPANVAASDAGNAFPGTAAPSPGSFGATPAVAPVSTPEDAAAARVALNGPYTGELPSGTGFIRNNATGDTRRFIAGGASPSDTGRAANDKYGFGQLIKGISRTRQAAAKTAALAAQGAYLRGEAAYMKAEEGAGLTTKISDALPGQQPIVTQVRGGVAHNIPVLQPIPAGSTPASLRAEAAAAEKRDPKNKAAIRAKLASYGLEPQ